jgi:hypothetical protein
MPREGFRVFGGVLPGEDASSLAETDATLVSLDVTDPASLRYSLLPLIPDRFVDRQVAKRVWRR